ncbi:ferredoxin [Streptomyces sp. NPDC057287]|uniref:ferredoxin n=1 Tax=Streptomyces sp. NPDC057287 TaxID=3346086 RepID=UPI00362B4175
MVSGVRGTPRSEELTARDGTPERRPLRVSADRSRCMAAGHCAVTAPGVFDHAEDGLVVVAAPEQSEEEREVLELAVELCPSRALTLSPEAAPSVAGEARRP